MKIKTLLLSTLLSISFAMAQSDPPLPPPGPPIKPNTKPVIPTLSVALDNNRIKTTSGSDTIPFRTIMDNTVFGGSYVKAGLLTAPGSSWMKVTFNTQEDYAVGDLYSYSFDLWGEMHDGCWLEVLVYAGERERDEIAMDGDLLWMGTFLDEAGWSYSKTSPLKIQNIVPMVVIDEVGYFPKKVTFFFLFWRAETAPGSDYLAINNFQLEGMRPAKKIRAQQI
ncbi:MAG TPA: hypothetical protein VNU93_06365, partial [Verrucomicrobiae bacterium]|nr:hypothetical protein [Verrucomicrobiae bacterium]